MKATERQLWWIAVILIALSRLPFIFYGYGSEEDAWALPLVTERIANTHHYEVSRLPGHPFQELAYTLIWDKGPVVYNLLTLIISTAGIGAFMLTLMHLRNKNWLFAGIALAATPIVFINSTNDMDYMWALSFMMISLYAIFRDKIVLAGIFIGMAIGCRITSGAIALPYLYLIYQLTKGDQRLKSALIFCASIGISTLIIFIPVLMNYGLSFFTYYEHFPIPGFAKNFYKGSIGAFGTIGFIVVVIFLLKILQRRKIIHHAIDKHHKITAQLLMMCTAAIMLYLIAFIKLPLKSAFIIPLTPYIWMNAAILLEKKEMRIAAVAMILSCFILGINLADPLRGSSVSKWSIEKEIAGQKIAIDPVSGVFSADISKRVQRTTYAKAVLQQTDTIQSKTYIIAGWWLADILVLQRGKENKNVVFGYYIEQDSLKNMKANNYQIYYLPQQEEFNDLRFKGSFTKAYAKAL